MSQNRAAFDVVPFMASTGERSEFWRRGLKIYDLVDFFPSDNAFFLDLGRL